MTGNYSAETVSALVALGGREWKAVNQHRVYFNLDACAAMTGLSVGYYKTGNVSCATLDGKKVSNSEARRILRNIGSTKTYVDLRTGAIEAATDLIKSKIKTILYQQMNARET